MDPVVESKCLFLGSAAENYWAISPHLVSLTAVVREAIATKLAGQPWGIGIGSTDDFESVFRHLRKFTKVLTPENEFVYFRFYDPRILNAFIESSTAEEVNQFFGPADVFMCEIDHAYCCISISNEHQTISGGAN